MMDITKSREAFEAEFRKQHAGNRYIEMLLKMYNHGTDEDPEIDYYSLAARTAWKWWQASRENIVLDLPEGWKLVPIKPTAEMLASAMECEDVVYDLFDDSVFCVQFDEIYRAMLAAAPQKPSSECK